MIRKCIYQGKACDLATIIMIKKKFICGIKDLVQVYRHLVCRAKTIHDDRT